MPYVFWKCILTKPSKQDKSSFLGVCWGFWVIILLKEKRKMKNHDRNIVNLNQKPSQPQLLKPDSNKEKEGKLIDSTFSPYGRFFIIKTTSNASTMMTKTNSPAIAGTKYKSAAVGSFVGCGVAVACASST